jgi:hypothetical protein
MPLGITEEIIARQPPEAQAIIRLLLAEIAKLEARVKELEGGCSGDSIHNSHWDKRGRESLFLTGLAGRGRLQACHDDYE